MDVCLRVLCLFKVRGTDIEEEDIPEAKAIN
jgi:hypothetical protein